MDSKHTHHCDDNKGTVKLQCYKLDFGVPDMIIFGYMTKYYHYLDFKKRCLKLLENASNAFLCSRKPQQDKHE